MKKRFSAFLLAALMVAALLPAVSMATDIQVADSAALSDAVTSASDGDTLILAAGEYTMVITQGKDLTIKAAENAEVKLSVTDGINMNGADVVFENVHFVYTNANYTGLQHSGVLTYNNCSFTGQPFLYGVEEIFNNCTFNQNSADAYNVWTYGAKKVTFNDCTFNCVGKSVLVYNEGATGTALTATNCEFIASAPVEGKAAIEIDSSLLSGADAHTINITDSSATGFAKGSVSGNELWNEKKSKTDENGDPIKLEPTIVMTPAPAYAGPVMNWVKINAADNGAVKSGPLAASAGATITLYPKAAVGFVLDTVEVLDAEGNAVALDGLKFAIPAGGVTVNATFKLAE